MGSVGLRDGQRLVELAITSAFETANRKKPDVALALRTKWSYQPFAWGRPCRSISANRLLRAFIEKVRSG
jgi:hypothetical protein